MAGSRLSFAFANIALISLVCANLRDPSNPAIPHRRSVTSLLWSKTHQLSATLVQHMAASSSAMTRAEYPPPHRAWTILRMQSAT